MEFTQLVEDRRSIRSYKAGMIIAKNDLEEMIKCAIEAPSWKNSQTARYYVVNTPEMLTKVRSEALPEFNQNNSANAGALIITAFEKHALVSSAMVSQQMKSVMNGEHMI